MWHDTKMLNAASNALFGLLALALLSAGLWWVAQRPMFTLKVIRIEGAEAPLRHIDPSTIRTTAHPWQFLHSRSRQGAIGIRSSSMGAQGERTA